jgi:hypothetical protein
MVKGFYFFFNHVKLLYVQDQSGSGTEIHILNKSAVVL